MIYSGITPVPVFDGQPTNLKKDLVDRRNSIKSNIYKKLKTENLSEKETKSLHVRSYVLSSEDIMDLKRLSNLLGLCCIQSPEEADAQCAILTLTNKVDAVMSDDTDIPVFGGLVTLQKFNKTTGREINLKHLLNVINLEFIDFVNVCIVLGSDYCPGVENIGPAKVLKLYKRGIATKGNQENMIKFIEFLERKTIYRPSKEFKKKWRLAQGYFTTNAKVYDPFDIIINTVEPDIDGLRKFLIEENDFNREKVEKQLAKITECLKKQKNGYV
jgi:flap endonuclease-1